MAIGWRSLCSRSRSKKASQRRSSPTTLVGHNDGTTRQLLSFTITSVCSFVVLAFSERGWTKLAAIQPRGPPSFSVFDRLRRLSFPPAFAGREASLSPCLSQAKTKKKIKKEARKAFPPCFFFDFSGSIDLVSFERIDARFLATSARVRSLASLPRTSRCTCHESTFLPSDRSHVRVSMLRKRNGGERRCGQVDRAGTLRDMDKQPRCNPRTKERKETMEKVSETNDERTLCAMQFENEGCPEGTRRMHPGQPRSRTRKGGANAPVTVCNEWKPVC